MLSLNLLPAQHKVIHFDRLMTRDGLSQNRIFDIVQDQTGFIWIASEDGLNRYDGYQFKVFKNIPGDSLSLADNIVQVLFTSAEGTLWIGTSAGGFCRFRVESESFETYTHIHTNPNSVSEKNIVSMSEDGRGNLWIGTRTKGFDYFIPSRKQFIHMKNMLPPGYQLDPLSLSFVHFDHKQQLWVGSAGKVHLFKVAYTAHGVPQLQPLPLHNQLFPSGVTCLEEDTGGTIWVGTFDEGLFRFDESRRALLPYPLQKTRIQLQNINISALESDTSGNLWLGGLPNGRMGTGLVVSGKSYGLIKLNLQTGKVQNFVNDAADETSISSDKIQSLFVDRTGVLWAGTWLSGVNKYDKSVIKFSLFRKDSQNPNGLPVNAQRGFYVDEHNKLWIASSGSGLLKYDPERDSYEIFTHDPANPTSISSVLARCLYDDGRYLWVGTLAGLNRFDKTSKKFKRFYPDSSDISSTANAITYNIIELDSHPGFLWFGTIGGGLVRFNKQSGQFKRYTYNPEVSNSLNSPDNYVFTVWHSQNRPGEIWAGTTNGIDIFDIASETFRYLVPNERDSTSLSNPNVMNFYEDADSFIWLATYGGGINRLDPASGKFIRFTEQNSDLPNNAVYGFLADAAGNLWLSTNNGISRFNPKTFAFRNYSVDDGLQGEEFIGGSFYKSPDGRMFFGGIDGFNAFYPEQVTDNTIIPEIVITDLKIFNNSVTRGRNISAAFPEGITLEHNQNDLSFSFVSLHYANPSKNAYAVMLENYEQEWRQVTNARVATYTNLDPGDYVFKVKGSNNDGIWNETGARMAIHIRPPWWRTNLAYLLYIVFIAAFIFAFDRIQRARIVAREKRKAEIALLEAENQRKSEELEEARRIQLSMLPRELPQLAHLDIAVYMQTATEVGGDYYDFHVAMDGTLTVVLGDATGHGMKAGTMVTAAKSLFNSYAPNPDICFSFQEISRCLKELNFGRMSMCMTMLKIRNNQLQMSSAGMPPGYIFRHKSHQVEEHMLQGMPLGTMSHFPYKIEDSPLGSGDTILLLTDGLPELQNEQEEMYGYQRIRLGFEQVATQNPEEIISYLKNEGSNWMKGATPDDDVTFVVIKVK